MSGTSWEGPPDKPRTLFESMYVGAIVLGVVTVSAVVSGIALFLLELLFGFIGLWLVFGLPLVVLLTAASGYTWRHIDPEDPFSYKIVQRDLTWWCKRKYNKYATIMKQKIATVKEKFTNEEPDETTSQVEDNPLLNETDEDEIQE